MTIEDEDDRPVRPDVMVSVTLDSGLMAWIDNMTGIAGNSRNEKMVFALRSFVIDNQHCFDKEAAGRDVRVLNDDAAKSADDSRPLDDGAIGGQERENP